MKITRTTVVTLLVLSNISFSAPSPPPTYCPYPLTTHAIHTPSHKSPSPPTSKTDDSCSGFVHAPAFDCLTIGSVPLSRVNDGVCDCCDGSDEFGHVTEVSCADVCGLEVEENRRRGEEERRRNQEGRDMRDRSMREWVNVEFVEGWDHRDILEYKISTLETLSKQEDERIKLTKEEHENRNAASKISAVERYFQLDLLTPYESILFLSYCAFLSSSFESVVKAMNEIGDKRYGHIYAVEGCDVSNPFWLSGSDDGVGDDESDGKDGVTGWGEEADVNLDLYKRIVRMLIP
eukprot:CAMPEP_0118650686 /NCGR_PEP_ID=MMETSP0785-20121206/10378_1 /TAXON_ID=91992 /ORGANISM="Bolidomonas pacifica, Strain CCMP 1866" /LENGTH=290 /DNA_ID=CAMNT_0006543075 /DNA_START=716 /DNA_END=1584 /DNA_ORIENTATION=+